MKALLQVLIIALVFGCKPIETEKQPIEKKDPIVINQTPIDYYGPLKVSGNQLLGKDNTPVQLRGMSLFWSQWIGKYYTVETVNWLKTDWNCNLIRAAMAVEAEGFLTNPETEKQKVFTVIDAAIANGIYVIVDWHDHHAENHMAEAKNFFGELAQKYGDKPNLIYETYNEPLKVSWTNVLKPYHQAIIDTIRHWDPDNLIVVGTPTWSQDVDVAANNPLTDTNLAYALHFYAGTHKQPLRDKATAALQKGIALFVTEFGTTDATGDGNVDEEETTIWLNFLDKNNLSWCNWSIADKEESSAALKPNTLPRGNWPTSSLTQSGRYVRTELLTKNQRFQ
jgi:endoglucanase